ncbi:hypothetical protein [Oceanibacterium hippocampi]|uniref:Uncharacterized protein n=1 Tax=Oceanibacterium hippocampi TaxID=745714 RepID=A0A1Y5U0I9_9PROT|nr:hypothetical protein [Oceanibacterium hippocampi]SLN77775.1 hypothetical protein OCH7691_04538 [Oceanibacterium hippocampi]
MPEFTKIEMQQELQTILLFEADHILLGRGEEAAEKFIGFSCGADGEYLHMDPERVDLACFPIAGSFERGYDFAFTPSVLCGLGEHEVQDLIVFMLGTPRAGGVSSGAELHRFMTPGGYCQTVADAVMARWKLEWEEGGSDFTTRELALLANMTEGAVRNALAGKGAASLTAIPGSKPVAVAFDEARRWLSGRRGFRATPHRPGQDPVLRERLSGLTDAVELGRIVRALRSETQSDEPGTLSDWPAADVEAWFTGQYVFDQQKAAELAKALDLDIPLFVGKALELSLRRDR